MKNPLGLSNSSMNTGSWPAGIVGAAAVVCLFLSVTVTSAQAQHDITLRFLDFQSGKPIKNFYLTIGVWSGNWTGPTVSRETTIISERYAKGHDGTVVVRLPERPAEAAPVIFTASTRADKAGRVIVHLPQTLPEHIRVSSFELTESVADFSPAEALTSGVVARYKHAEENSRARVSAEPGEIVILNKRVTALDRMHREIP